MPTTPDVNAEYRKFRSDVRGLVGRPGTAHILDILILGLIVLVVSAAVRDGGVASDHLFVANPGGLVPFHAVLLSDLVSDCRKRTPATPASAGRVIGRYSAEYLKSCAPIDPSKLSALPLLDSELAGRVLIRLKSQPTPLFSGMRAPARASLIFAPRDHGLSPLILDDVLILDLQKSGDDLSVVVAVLKNDEATIAAFVARSDVVMVSSTR